VTARQDILDYLQDELEEIESFDGRIYQIGQAGVDMAEQPAAFLGWTEDRIETGPANGRFSRFLQAYVVIVCQEGEDGLPDAVDGLLAEVEAVCMADPTQGGNAYDTRNVASELRPVIEGFPDAVAAVSFEVLYFVAALGEP
jgi:hypothetical protein